MFYDILKIGAFFGGASFVDLKKIRVFWVFLVVVVFFTYRDFWLLRVYTSKFQIKRQIQRTKAKL